MSNNDNASKVGDEEEDAKVEEGKEVNQVKDPTLVPAIAPPAQIPPATPILVLSLAIKVVDDIDFSMVAPATEDLIKHSFNKGDNLGYNSKEEEDMGPRARVLEKKKAAGDKLTK